MDRAGRSGKRTRFAVCICECCVRPRDADKHVP
jgi:hypothetical protein